MLEENVVRNHRKANEQVHMQGLQKGISLLPPFQTKNKENLNILIKGFTESGRRAWGSFEPKKSQKDYRRQFNIAKLTQVY